MINHCIRRKTILCGGGQSPQFLKIFSYFFYKKYGRLQLYNENIVLHNIVTKNNTRYGEKSLRIVFFELQ